MKIFLNTTVDFEEEAKQAEEYLKRFCISIVVNRIDLDESNEALYETTNSWSWFKIMKTKSLSSSVIKALGVAKGGVGYDYYGLVVDKKKAVEDSSLLGQHNLDYKVIEIYKTGKKTKRHGLPYNVATLVHEILHALSHELNKKDLLHDYLDKHKRHDEYLDYILPEKEEIKDLLPLVKRKIAEFEKIMSLVDPITIVSGFRGIDEQDELYAQGRTKSGKIITNAKGGESMHNYGVAIDYCFKNKPYYPETQSKRWNRANAIAMICGFYSYGIMDKFDDGHIQLMLDYSEKDFRNGQVDYSLYE